MDLLEYQGKQLFARHDIPVPNGRPATTLDEALVPTADLVLRRFPDGTSDETALFAGDVMGTAFHAVDDGHVRPGSRPRAGRHRGGCRWTTARRHTQSTTAARH